MSTADEKMKFRDHLPSYIGWEPQFDDLNGYCRRPVVEMESHARAFYESICRRMGFLNDICARPPSEKPFLLLVTGFPADGCTVPRFGGVKKSEDEFSSWLH